LPRPPKPSDLQEVVVYGIRASLRESLESKRAGPPALEGRLDSGRTSASFRTRIWPKHCSVSRAFVINREFGEGRAHQPARHSPGR